MLQTDVDLLRKHVDAHGLRATARDLQLSTHTITRALKGKPIAQKTLAVLRARVKRRDDFVDVPRVEARPRKAPCTSWTLESIRAGVEAQYRGDFALPQRMAEAMRRDDAIYVARANRLAVLAAIRADVVAHDSERGRVIAARARDSVHVARTVLADIAATLVDHGVAIGYVEQESNDTGTRMHYTLTEWPIESVRVNASTQQLEALTDDGQVIPITHGDGRWIIFRKRASMPWRDDACLLPGAFVWAAHAEGVADISGSSRAHGLAKLIGELPDGSALNGDAGAIDEMTTKFAAMLSALVDGSSSIGIRPNGAKTDWVSSASNAWQVFVENIGSREKAAARIYLGTDAVLGAAGGAPGVDISALFGVATTKIQGDVTAIEEGLASGLYAPWCAVNEGSSRYAPCLRFALPDPDATRKREEQAANRTRFANALAELRAQGMRVTQEIVESLAKDFDVHPIPELAPGETSKGEMFAYHLDYGVFSINEIRASRGLPPVPWGDVPPKPIADVTENAAP